MTSILVVRMNGFYSYGAIASPASGAVRACWAPHGARDPQRYRALSEIKEAGELTQRRHPDSQTVRRGGPSVMGLRAKRSVVARAGRGRGRNISDTNNELILPSESQRPR